MLSFLIYFCRMKNPEKKIKRKEDVRNLILNAAKKLFVEEGYQSASIRKIASEIGYSPTTIYLYYKDKNDIVHALHTEGFAILRMMFSSLESVEHPFERLKAIGRTYLRFAKEYPDFYEVMFIMKEPMDYLESEDGPVCWEEGKQVFALLVLTVIDCQEAGYFPDSDPNHTALQAWSMVHGLCSLHITTHLQKVGEECLSESSSDVLVESAFKTYVSLMEQTKIKK